MKAVVLAGGKGSRLLPYSAHLPKSLMPVDDRPILELLLGLLKASGITEIILAVNHLRHLIQAYFGDGSRWGMSITYSVEDVPLGTAGPISLVLDRLGPNFIVANGDLLTTLDIAGLIAKHFASEADITVAAQRRSVRSNFGVIETDSSSHIVGYQEKPVQTHLVSMGLYVVRTFAVRPFLAFSEYLDMPDLITATMRSTGRAYCYESECYWLDIGRPDDFALAQQMISSHPQIFSALPDGACPTAART